MLKTFGAIAAAQLALSGMALQLIISVLTACAWDSAGTLHVGPMIFQKQLKICATFVNLHNCRRGLGRHHPGLRQELQRA